MKSLPAIALLLFITPQLAAENIVSGYPKSVFKAAVYEHALYRPPNYQLPVSREEALRNMKPNLDVLQSQVKAAAEQGADIFVFPEDGLCGLGFSRIALSSYLEYMPDPKKVTWTPCTHPDTYPGSDVQVFLSCLARNHSLYLVVNFGDKQPCDQTDDPVCPEDGHFQYNTDIVFSPEGTLIAKYHKEHLFYEYQYDKPKTLNIATFDTPFGRFGVFTCFDVLFHDPPIQLIEKYNVSNVVFPTAWMDALPLLAAIQFHSAFAMGMGVNFLAANIHAPDFRFQGSGIYTPDGASAFYYNDTSGSSGSLLVREIPVLETPRRRQVTINSEEKFKQLKPQASEDFKSLVFGDLFNFVALEQAEDNLTVCHNQLCCHLQYNMAPDEKDFYAFGAFDGLHTFEGQYYLQICSLLRCANNNPKSCGSVTKEAATIFSRLRISGSFQTKYVFPEVLLYKGNFLSLAPGEFQYQDGDLVSPSGFEAPLLSASLFGRIYTRDNSTVDEDYDPNICSRTASSFMVIMIAIMSTWCWMI